MTQHSNVGPTSNSNALLARVDRLNRLTRILISMLITVFIVGFIWLGITLLFGVNASSNTIVRLLVIFGSGFVAYVYGWQVMVGFDDQPGAWHATPRTLWYLLVGLIAFVLDIALLVGALMSSNLL